jgi:hypothetical protein
MVEAESGITTGQIVTKTVVTHTVTYFLAGVLAFFAFNYPHLYADTSLALLMRPTTDTFVMAGPLFQPIRGLVFGLVFSTLRGPFFGQQKGWLLMWAVLVALGILGAFGPAPGSLEGMIYTVLPFRLHLIGLPETLLQSLVLSFVVFHWVNNPRGKAFSWIMGSLFVLVLLLPTLGLLYGPK